MMKEIKAPHQLNYSGKSIFLAGSIEMGTADNWQERITQLLAGEDVTILNPRRDDWDSTWRQSIEDSRFSEQVEWELTALEAADLILMYFAPDTKSPITLLELGLFARAGKLIVCCPEKFWRKGNVDAVCQRYDIERVSTLEDLAQAALRGG